MSETDHDRQADRGTNGWPAPRRVDTHLGPLEYHDLGAGPAIVFLHLLLADASHWDRVTPLLTDRFRCILPTLPMGAHRLPAHADTDLSARGLARAVAELLDHLDVDDVTLVGNDTGGAIAQVVAADHPRRLGRVVLTNCDMYDDFPPKTFAYLKPLGHLPGSMALLGRTLKIRALWSLPFVFGRLTYEVRADKVDQWADALLADRRVRRDVRRVLASVDPRITNEAAAALRSTDLPFLVAWGADDKAFRPALAQRFCAEVATAELVMIEDAKTFVCWDQPERLAALIAEFAAHRPEPGDVARRR